MLLRDHCLAQERVRRVETCAVDRVVDRHDSSVGQQDVISATRDSGPWADLLVSVLQGAVLGIDGIDVIGEAVGRGRWGCGGGGGTRQTVAVPLGSREAQRGGQRKDGCDANLWTKKLESVRKKTNNFIALPDMDSPHQRTV